MGAPGKNDHARAQLKTLNDDFAPPPEQILRARRGISGFEAADTDRVALDGRLTDQPRCTCGPKGD